MPPADDALSQHRAVADRVARLCGIARRAAWGATPPAKPLEPDWDYDSIVVHYTGHGSYPNMAAIQAFDVGHRHWDDVAYHYAIAATGKIYEGRELVFKGSHLRNQNTGKIGIVCMGDFDSGVRNLLALRPYGGDPVQPAMLAALERLSRTLMDSFRIKTFGGHLEFGESETCPGSSLLPLVKAIRIRLKLAAPMHRTL